MKETVQIVFMLILETVTIMEEYVVKEDMVVITGQRIGMAVFIIKDNYVL